MAGKSSGDKTQTVPQSIDWTKYGQSGTGSSGAPNYANEYQFFAPNSIAGQDQTSKDPAQFNPDGTAVAPPPGATTPQAGAAPDWSKIDWAKLQSSSPGLYNTYHSIASTGQDPNAPKNANAFKNWGSPGNFQQFVQNWYGMYGKDQGFDPTPFYSAAQGGIAGYAGGGWPSDGVPSPGSSVEARGFLPSPSPGRADTIRTRVKRGSYIFPSDVVSGLGQGNSLHGAHLLDRMSAHYSHIPGEHYTPGMPGTHYDSGGIAGDGMMDVHLSGGEYVTHPQVVSGIGEGDPDRGADMCDDLCKRVRKGSVKHVKTTPPPK